MTHSIFNNYHYYHQITAQHNNGEQYKLRTLELNENWNVNLNVRWAKMQIKLNDLMVTEENVIEFLNRDSTVSNW